MLDNVNLTDIVVHLSLKDILQLRLLNSSVKKHVDKEEVWNVLYQQRCIGNGILIKKFENPSEEVIIYHQ
jgi:hypothetical protein